MAKYIKASEMRDVPGFTNYVVSTRKNIGGTVCSAELKRYYSNIDAEIYIDGEYFEDIQSIDWDIQSNKMPLYGFNSFIWDDVAFANRIIHGSFVVNFTRPRAIDGYIQNEYSAGGGYSDNAKEINYEDEFEIAPKNEDGSLHIVHDTTGATPWQNDIHKALWNIRFDIDIVCGECEPTGDYPVHIILSECYIIDSRSMRNKDGGVAAEIYSFIARDLKTIS